MVKRQCELTVAAEMEDMATKDTGRDSSGWLYVMWGRGRAREHAEDPGGLGACVEKEREVKREEPILERRGEFGFWGWISGDDGSNAFR